MAWKAEAVAKEETAPSKPEEEKRPAATDDSSDSSDSSNSSDSSDSTSDLEDPYYKQLMAWKAEAATKDGAVACPPEAGKKPATTTSAPKKMTETKEDDSSDSSSDSDSEGADFHRKPWMVKANEEKEAVGKTAEDTNATKSPSQDTSKAREVASETTLTKDVETVDSSDSSPDSDGDPADFQRNEWMVKAIEDKASTSDDSRKDLPATPSSTDKTHGSPLVREAATVQREETTGTPSSPVLSKIEQLREKRRQQQAHIQKSIGTLSGNSTTSEASTVVPGTPPESALSTTSQIAATTTPATLSQAQQQHAAREANLALAVLSYLKFNGLEGTANLFAREWQKVHGISLTNESAIMGIIRWEPLLPESFPCFSFPQGQQAAVAQGPHPNSKSAPTPSREPGPSVHVEKKSGITLQREAQPIVESVRPANASVAELSAAEKSVVKDMDSKKGKHSTYSHKDLDDIVGALENFVADNNTSKNGTEEETNNANRRHSTGSRRGARKGIIRTQSELTSTEEGPQRRTIRRSVSFDQIENQVRHIPRYEDSVKGDCFYKKEELNTMRLDHQMEKQQAATDALMNFINMANTQLGVPKKGDE